MKRTKVATSIAAVVALSASLFVTGCTSPVVSTDGPEVPPLIKPDTPPVVDPETPPAGEPETPPTSEPEENVMPGTKTDMSFDSFYKTVFKNYEGGAWGSGTTITVNDDGSYTLATGNAWWGDKSGVCLPFVGIEKATLQKYDYIGFTADFSDFKIINTDAAGDNFGINIKIPDTQSRLPFYTENEDGTYTYYGPISNYSGAATAVEFAVIMGGEGTVTIKEVFAVAAEEVSNVVKSISISPDSTSIKTNKTIAFTVVDSNLEDVTANTTFTIVEEDTACSIENNLLTSGNEEETVTVKAEYTVDEKTFEATAVISVMKLDNLITDVSLNRLYVNPSWAGIVYDNVSEVSEDVVAIDGNNITVNTPAGLNAKWQYQLCVKTDADIKAGQKFVVSFNISGLDGNYTFKLNDTVQFIPECNGSFVASGSEISYSDTATVSVDDLLLLFDFGTCAEGTITISDITFAVVEE